MTTFSLVPLLLLAEMFSARGSRFAPDGTSIARGDENDSDDVEEEEEEAEEGEGTKDTLLR